MGFILPPKKDMFKEEFASFTRFRRALRAEDQDVLDELFAYAQQHSLQAAYSSHPVPVEVFLVSMLLEQHKEVARLRRLVDELRGQDPIQFSEG